MVTLPHMSLLAEVDLGGPSIFYEEVFRTPNKKRAGYVAAGGIALVLHGFARFSADLDLIPGPVVAPSDATVGTPFWRRGYGHAAEKAPIIPASLGQPMEGDESYVSVLNLHSVFAGREAQ